MKKQEYYQILGWLEANRGKASSGEEFWKLFKSYLEGMQDEYLGFAGKLNKALENVTTSRCPFESIEEHLTIEFTGSCGCDPKELEQKLQFNSEFLKGWSQAGATISFEKIKSILSEERYKEFLKFMEGQTCSGDGVYPGDLERFLRGLPVVD